MVSFQRMKDDFDGISSQVEAKLPSKTVICASLLVCALLVFLLGVAAGVGSAGVVDYCAGETSCNVGSIPVYHALGGGNESCPPLAGEMLVTTVNDENSFEGLSVHLQCETGYTPFPSSVRCGRRSLYDGSSRLQWSSFPVCYPDMMEQAGQLDKIEYARSVSCVGSPGSTQCRLQCINSYVAVEKAPYICSSLPCPAWTQGGRRCYVCSDSCQLLEQLHRPTSGDLLRTMTCDPHCDKIVVTSDGSAAIWQSKRTGLFHLVGEHNGRPAFQNLASKEYLYYTVKGAEWLVGPNFRKQKAGIQVFKNDDKACPERHGGSNTTSLYMDSSKPSPVGRRGGMWKNDTTIRFSCYSPSTPVKRCSCSKYKVYHTVYQNSSVPKQVQYLSGTFKKVEHSEETFGLLAPLYKEEMRDLFLFSYHPEGKVWQISEKLTTTPIRGVFSYPACPDSEDITWELYNKTTRQGEQQFVKDRHIQVKCLDLGWGS